MRQAAIKKWTKRILITFGVCFLGLLIVAVAAVMIPVLTHRNRKTDNVKIRMELLGRALQAYKLNCGFYPKSEAGLKALITNVSQCPNWQGPHVKETMFIDPWGNSIAYQFDGDSVLLTSFAKDGKPGGEDDDQDISVRVSDLGVEVVGEK